MPTTIFGLNIADGGFQKALDTVQGFVRSGGKHLVVTVNPEILVYARRHKRYWNVLQEASLLLPDGTGVVFAGYALGSPVTSGRVPGVDLVEQLIAQSSVGRYSVFLVGKSKSVLQKATLNLLKSYPNINIVGYEEGPEIMPEESYPILDPKNDLLIKKIIDVKPDVLLVGFGHPKQEYWINYHLHNLPVRLAMGVGGSLDYFSGNASRAPKVFRWLGIEWLWRLVLEPRRIGRILTAVLVFSGMVFMEVFRKLFHVEQS